MLVLTLFTAPEVHAGLGLSRYDVDAQVLIGSVVSIPFVRIYNNENMTLKINFILLSSNLSTLTLPESITMEPDTSKLMSVEVDASDYELEFGRYAFDIELAVEPNNQNLDLSPVVPGGTIEGFITVYDLNIIDKIAKRWDIIGVASVAVAITAFMVKRGRKSKPKKPRSQPRRRGEPKPKPKPTSKPKKEKKKRRIRRINRER